MAKYNFDNEWGGSVIASSSIVGWAIRKGVKYALHRRVSGLTIPVRNPVVVDRVEQSNTQHLPAELVGRDDQLLFLPRTKEEALVLKKDWTYWFREGSGDSQKVTIPAGCRVFLASPGNPATSAKIGVLNPI